MTPYSNQKDLFYGEVFGLLTVTNPHVSVHNSVEKLYSCMCRCGGYVKATASELRENLRSSCGCKPTAKPRKNLRKRLAVGSVYGDYTIIKCIGAIENNRVQYRVECQCGEVTSMDGSRLSSKRSVMCSHG